MSSKITTAGETFISDIAAGNITLTGGFADQILIGYQQGIDATVTPDSDALPDTVLETVTINKKGLKTANVAVFNAVLLASMGDYTFNWLGLYNSEHSVLIAVVYEPAQQKWATTGEQVGNVLNKAIGIQVDNASGITGITASIESWQVDYQQEIVELTAVHEETKAAAEQATATAEQASTDSTSAVETANSAARDAATAVEEVNAAVNTVNGAVEDVNAAVNTVNGAVEDVNAAVNTVNGAVEDVNAAVNTVNGAVEEVNAAVNTVNGAVETANSAKTTAETDASTTQAGRVQLSSATDSDSETMAATPAAVKAVAEASASAAETANSAKGTAEAALPASGNLAGLTDLLEAQANMGFRAGTVTSTIDDAETFTFDTAFPTACVVCMVIRVGSASMAIGPYAWTKTGFTVDRDAAIDGSQQLAYFAIGY